MISPINNAASGLHAAAKRIETVADNVANAQNKVNVPTTQAAVKTPPKDEGARGDETFYTGYRPVRVHQESVEGGGTKATVREIDPSFELYRGDESKGESQVVARPNVELIDEFVEASQARHAFSANLKALEAADKTLGTLLDRES